MLFPLREKGGEQRCCGRFRRVHSKRRRRRFIPEGHAAEGVPHDCAPVVQGRPRETPRTHYARRVSLMAAARPALGRDVPPGGFVTSTAPVAASPLTRFARMAAAC